MTTKLEVLNHMLNVIGEAPVSSSDSNHPSALSALVTLNRVNKEFQNRGWWFNTEYDLPLVPNEAGQIILPSTALFVDPVDPLSNLVKRQGKLYDPVNHTFIINETIRVNAVLLLDVADLPEVAATYLLHLSAYDFYVNDDGDEAKATRLRERVTFAWAALKDEEYEALNLNAKARPQVAHLRMRLKQAGIADNPTWPGGRGRV